MLKFGLLLLLPFIYAESIENSFEAMVAFQCGFPTMYMKGDEWTRDDSQNCIKDPQAILQYCKNIYPTLDVRNIVQMTEKVSINHWCKKEEKKCNKQFSVKPYRCLVGPFQSDALLVPDGCIFDHIHDSKQCSDEADWARKSQRSCTDRVMVRMSFAMLQPCAIDKFTGVEFVCCPKTALSSKDSERIEASDPSTTTQKSSKPDEKKEIKMKKPKEDRLHYVMPIKKGPVVQDYFAKYLGQTTGDEKWNEHDAFTKARTDMNLHHKDKIAKMMKDWQAARARVEALKEIDPIASEKLNTEITQRFQKMYEAEETEADDEKRQLNILHQQRIQADLNNKKQQALDAYLDTLEDPDVQSSELLKSLRQYMKALQKDRLHSINHWRHTQAIDPMLADETREHVRMHIVGIDAQLEDSTRMLDRLPRIKQKIINQISDFLEAYHSVDSSIVDLMRPVIEDPLVEDDYNDDVDDDSDDEDDNEESNDENDDVDDDDDGDNDEDDEYYGQNKKNQNQAKKAGDSLPVASNDIKQSGKAKQNTEAKDKLKDKEEFFKQKSGEANHLQSNQLHVEQGSSLRKSLEAGTGSSFAIPLGVLVGLLTVVIVIVVGVTVMRTRAHIDGQRYSQASAADSTASPEERHVAIMQANGYENPTYKYFEKNVAA